MADTTTTAAAAILPILHFNDVYRVSQTSKSGTISADQFAAKIAQIRTKWGEKSRALDFLRPVENQGTEQHQKHVLHGLTLFSGDVFNPSIESSVTRGSHMIEVLNALSIDCACLGNHDFDFGYPHLQQLMKQTNFPWTFTNIADVGHSDATKGHEENPQENDAQVEGTLRHWVEEVQGIRIGCIGLVERDWIATVPAFPPNFRYRSMVETAKAVSKELRDPQGSHRCDIVIALTHCRLPNDVALAKALGAVANAPEGEHGVDLVLGGHDHTYYIGKGVESFSGDAFDTEVDGDTGCMIVKSGTDFHDLSEIELQLSEPKQGAVRRRRIIGASVRRHKTLPSDATLPELKAHIDELLERVNHATDQPVAFALTPLDCRMDKVRTQEEGVGSFVADILLHSYDETIRERDRRGEMEEKRPEDQREVDIALICGGSLRGDSVFGPGIIAIRDVLTILPFEDAVIVRQLKGKDILEALENGFGAYPSQEGRFPQLAGLSVVWDSSRPPGQRVVEARLLEDVHLFHEDGTRKAEGTNDGTASPSEGAETYAFERSEDGGYAIDMHKPRIRKGPKLEPERVYRVVTREYLADGHDGYESLTRACGPDPIDHENGALMSTQVRKFLLGASLIWRLKAFRDNSDEQGKGVVGHVETLSTKTRRAIERAHAITAASPSLSASGDFAAAIAADDSKPSMLSATSAGFEAGIGSTPQKSGRRFVVDSSPGAFRDAIHVGASEHHSHHDPASKRFKDSRRGPASALLAHTGGAGNISHAGDESLDSIASSIIGEQPMSAPARTTDGASSSTDGPNANAPMSAGGADSTFLSPPGGGAGSGGGGGAPYQSAGFPTASTMAGSNDDVLLSSSSYFSPKAVRQHVEVNAEDGAQLRAAQGSLAIIAPMRDGRMVDRARLPDRKKTMSGAGAK